MRNLSDVMFRLDSGTLFYECDDGSFYLATGDDYYDVELTREQARALRDWLSECLEAESP